MKRTSLAAVIALVFAAGSLTACMDNSGQETSAGPGNQINPMAYAEVPVGGTLDAPLSAPIVNFNPSEADGMDANTSAVVSPLLPSLFTTDQAGAFHYNPDYLVKEPTVTDHPQAVTYDLNPNAIWSDGTHLSYADFAGMWKANNGTDTTYHSGSTEGYTSIASVQRGTNDQQVVVVFKTTYADWRGLFNLLLPASTTTKPGVFNTGWVTKPLTSAGPFMFAGQSRTTYTMVPNPQWWGRKPRLAGITFHVISPAAQADALAEHRIDFMDVGADAGTYARVKTLPDIEVRSAASADFRHITFNASSPVLKDLAVRQALAMGIDRTAIARTMLTPLGVTDPVALGNHVFMTNQYGYRDNSGDVGKFNPAKAAAKLTAAGWLIEGDHRVKAGQTLKLKMVIPAGVPVSDHEATLIQQQLANIQVKVTITRVNSSAFFTGYVAKGKFDLTVFTWLGSEFPVVSAAALYANQANGDWGSNFARVGSDQIDQDFRTAEVDPSASQSVQDANVADALIWQEAGSLPTYQRPSIIACDALLVNFGAFGLASLDYTSIGFAP